MPSNQKTNTETAIVRVRLWEPIEVNATTVYATYTSRTYNGFYATEKEAVAHCSNSNNRCEFNGEWIQDSYSVFQPGELFTVVGSDSVYISADRSRYLDAAMSRSQISFVEWKAESPLAV